MKIEKEKLKKALEIVKPGLSNNTLIEQATSFCFLNGKVVTYNDEISISAPIDLELEGAINSTELYGFLNKVSGDEINMELSDSEILLSAGRAKAGLTLKTEITLPIEEVGEIKKWTKLPKGFLKAVDFARGSCSRDMSKPILTCVHVNGNIIEGSDSYRVVKTELENTVKINAFLVPASICGTIIKFHPKEIAEGQGWVHFKSENDAILSCRVFEETYPKTSQFFEIEGTRIEFPKPMLEVLEKAEVFAKRDRALEEFVTITIDSKRLTVRSESENGWFEEKTKIEHSGDPVSFSITLYLLKDILRETSSAIISENKLLFEGENWKYLTLLRG